MIWHAGKLLRLLDPGVDLMHDLITEGAVRRVMGATKAEPRIQVAIYLQSWPFSSTCILFAVLPAVIKQRGTCWP